MIRRQSSRGRIAPMRRRGGRLAGGHGRDSLNWRRHGGCLHGQFKLDLADGHGFQQNQHSCDDIFRRHVRWRGNNELHAVWFAAPNDRRRRGGIDFQTGSRELKGELRSPLHREIERLCAAPFGSIVRLSR